MPARTPRTRSLRPVDAPLGGDVRADALLPGKAGSALQRYTRLANDLLFNPEASIERVTQAYEQQPDADRDGGGDQRSLSEATGLAQVEQVSTEIRDLADQFEEREAQLRARFETAAE